MYISLHRKFFLVLVLVLTSFLIKDCENFQLKDLNSGPNAIGNEVEKSNALSGQKYQFRKLNIKNVNFDTIDDNDDDDDDDDDEDDDSNGENDNFVFLRVRKPSYEVKKRQLRPSKIAELLNDDDTNSEEEDDDENDDQQPSLFSKIFSFFKKDTEIVEKSEDVSEENEEENDDAEDENEEKSESKSFVTSVLEKVTGMFGGKPAENVNEIVEETREENNDNSNDAESDDTDNDTEVKEEEEAEEDQPSESFVEKVKKAFPFNYFFGDNDDEDDDSDEDEKRYKEYIKHEETDDNDDDDDENDDDDDDDEKEIVKKLIPKVKQEVVKKSSSTSPKETKPSKPPVKKVEKPQEKISILPDDFDNLLRNLPSFIPDYTKVENAECRKQGQIFKRQLRGQKIWALQMMDANAKVPSGLLRGNTNQLGDFDLCTRISQKIKISDQDSMKMKGKYCLANIDVTAAVEELKLPVHLMQGRNFMRSTINDPNHFFPRYSTINWGLCLPAACTYQDAEKVLKSFIGPYNSTGIKMHVKVDENSCSVRRNVHWMDLLKNNYRIFITSMIFLFLFGVTVTASLNDYWEAICKNSIFGSKSKDGDKKSETETMPILNENTFINKVLMSFSVKKTFPALFGFSVNENEFKCIHGLKAIGIVMLFLSLKLIPMGRFPYSNRNKLTEFFNSPLSVFLRSSFLYEDMFLVISGFLTAYHFIEEISKNGKILWTKRIFNRFFRLVTPLALVLLFYSWLWEHIGNGPQWGNIVVDNADLCKTNMWKNVLFIQNFFPFENMCATHTYHLAVDMQLFLITPILIWMIYKYPVYGLGLYGILQSLSAAARFSATIDNRLSVVIFHGMKLSQLYRTANLSFAIALHRATPYLIGVGLAIFIKEFKKVELPKGAVVCGWLSTLAAFFWCFWAPAHLSHKDYQYEPISSAHYAALAPLVWSLGIAWVIFACISGNSGRLNWLFGTRPMYFLSKITYSIYLTMFLVFFYFSGTSRSGEEFQLSSYIDRLELIVIIIVATLFTLIVDLPIQNIKQLLKECKTAKNVPSTENNLLDENQNVDEEPQAVEEDFENPFGDRDDDFVPVRPTYFRRDFEDSETESSRNYINDDYNTQSNGDDIGGQADGEEEEDDADVDGEDEDIPEESEVIRNPENTMNSRRWRWEVLDD